MTEEGQQVGPGFYVKMGMDNSGIIDSAVGMAMQFDFVVQAAETMEHAVQGAFDATVGAAISASDQIRHFSDVTGMSEDAVQKWKSANIAVGGSLDSMQQSLSYVQGRLADTSTAGETYRGKLENLGIAYKDLNGQYLDADQLQKNILESISNISNATERDSALREIYGRSWQNNAELFTNAKTALDAYNSTASPFSDDQIQAAHQMGIEMDQFDAKMKNTQATLGMELLPATEEWLGIINDASASDSPIYTFFQDLNGLLVEAARGFHIMGSEAQFANDILHGDFAGANQTAKDQMAWEQSENTKDALRAGGYMQGKVWDSSKGTWVWPSSGSGSTDGSGGSSDPMAAVATTTSQTNANKDLAKSLDELAQKTKTYSDEQKKLQDLKYNYLQSMQAAGGDLARMRQLTMSYNQSQRSATSNLADAGAAMGAAEQGVAKAAGDLIINIDGKTLATIPGVISGAATSNTPRVVKGIRTSTG